MTIQEMAEIIEAEASVLDMNGKLAVAQCIRDNDYNPAAFTTPADNYSQDSLAAARAVMCDGVERIPGAKILQFRSYKNYGVCDDDGGWRPDDEKVRKTSKWPISWELSYLGKDERRLADGSIAGHFYYGIWDRNNNSEKGNKNMKPFKLLVMAGHGRNVDGSYDPGAIGCGYREADLTRELAKLIVAKAKVSGIDCDLAPDRNHFSFFRHGGVYDVTQYSYVLEVHFNASTKQDTVGDGAMKGSMMYISKDEKGHSVEDAILRNLYAAGSCQAWTGVVVTQTQPEYANGLMVQNAIRRQGVSHAVLETCFVTDKDDMVWYHAKKSVIAKAVVDGIVEGFGLAKSDSSNENRSWVGKGIATGTALTEMNIRAYASIYSKKIATVPAGTQVEILEELQDGWLKIVWPGNLEKGYAFTSARSPRYWEIKK